MLDRPGGVFHLNPQSGTERLGMAPVWGEPCTHPSLAPSLGGRKSPGRGDPGSAPGADGCSRLAPGWLPSLPGLPFFHRELAAAVTSKASLSSDVL